MTLFDEQVRIGWWLLPETAALSLIAVGCVVLARSPLATGSAVPPPRVK